MTREEMAAILREAIERYLDRQEPYSYHEPSDSDYLAFADAILTAQAAERGLDAGVVEVFLAEREDGGLRVWSDDEPGLILSGPDPQKVGADIWPAIRVLRQHRALLAAAQGGRADV